jgi:hypothetical protein
MLEPIRHFPIASGLAFAGVTAATILVVPPHVLASALGIPLLVALLYGTALLIRRGADRAQHRRRAEFEIRVRELGARNATLEREGLLASGDGSDRLVEC